LADNGSFFSREGVRRSWRKMADAFKPRKPADLSKQPTLKDPIPATKSISTPSTPNKSTEGRRFVIPSNNLFVPTEAEVRQSLRRHQRGNPVCDSMSPSNRVRPESQLSIDTPETPPPSFRPPTPPRHRKLVRKSSSISSFDFRLDEAREKFTSIRRKSEEEANGVELRRLIEVLRKSCQKVIKNLESSKNKITFNSLLLRDIKSLLDDFTKMEFFLSGRKIFQLRDKIAILRGLIESSRHQVDRQRLLHLVQDLTSFLGSS